LGKKKVFFCRDIPVQGHTHRVLSFIILVGSRLRSIHDQVCGIDLGRILHSWPSLITYPESYKIDNFHAGAKHFIRPHADLVKVHDFVISLQDQANHCKAKQITAKVIKNPFYSNYSDWTETKPANKAATIYCTLVIFYIQRKSLKAQANQSD
jgi:hypothetical protein